MIQYDGRKDGCIILFIAFASFVIGAALGVGACATAMSFFKEAP